MVQGALFGTFPVNTRSLQIKTIISRSPLQRRHSLYELIRKKRLASRSKSLAYIKLIKKTVSLSKMVRGALFGNFQIITLTFEDVLTLANNAQFI